MRIALAKLLLRTAESAAAGRADEPPRSRSSQLAGGVSDELSERVRADLARSVLPGCHGRQDRRDLEQAGCISTRGNYEKYLPQKAERQAQLEAAYKNQQERIEQLESFINRFRSQATKAKQVQSRIKELEKIERIEMPPEEKTIHFSFPQPKPSGRIVAEFQNVSKSYGDRSSVFANVNFYHRARRSRRAGWRERRGEVDADQAALRRRAADIGRVQARA